MKGHIEDILVGGRPMTKNEIKIKELQDRIDKAIEYTKQFTNGKTSSIDEWKNVELVLENILEILKGE